MLPFKTSSTKRSLGRLPMICIFLSLIYTIAETTSSFVNDDCDTTNGCFSDTLGSRVLYRSTDNGLAVAFEVVCELETNGWCSVGFSDTGGMSPASVLDCILNNGSIVVQHSYNGPGKANSELGNPENYITNVQTSYENGTLTCSFQRSVEVSENGTRIFSLNTPYFLLLGKGNMRTTGLKARHTRTPAISASKVDVRFNPSMVMTTASPTTSEKTCELDVGCFNSSEGNLVKYSETIDGLAIAFEIICELETDGWCSLGFSNTGSMSPASVLDCILSNGSIKVQHSYNGPRKENTELGNPENYITNVQTSYENGTLTCSFQRSVEVSGNDTRIFSLNTPYYLLLGKGNMRTTGLKARHTRTPAISPSKVDVRFNPSMVMTTASPTTSEKTCELDVGCFNSSEGNLVKYSETIDGLAIAFEIICELETDGWCSLGFSNTGSMSPASVLDCILSNSSIKVQHSYNGPRKENTELGNPENYITNVQTSYENGTLTCSFQRSVEVSGNDTRIFSLNTPYYLLLGKGNMRTTGLKTRHTRTPAVSASKVDVRFNPSMVVTTASPTTSEQTCELDVGCFNSSEGNLVKYSETIDGLAIAFEIICELETDGWCSLGFSNNGLMSPASVLDCILSNGSIKVQHSYNGPRRENIELGNPDNYITNVQTSYENGTLTCSFQRSVEVSENDTRIFSLNTPYYLLLGKGNVRTTGSKLRHPRTPAVSPRKVDVRFPSLTMTTAVTTEAIYTTANSEICGDNVGCFNSNQGNLAKYSETEDGRSVEFEIVCELETDGWCSLGFSNTRSMYPASVLDCIRYSNGTIKIQHSYNGPGYQNSDLGKPDNYITNIKTSYDNGVLTCRFLRTIDVSGDTYGDRIFSLNTAYYLLLGKGELESSGLKAAHTRTPAISSSKIDVRFSPSTNTESSSTSTTALPGDEACGVTVGCFSSGDGNLVKFAPTSDGLAVAFEITCSSNTDGWCSVGFSNTGKMSPASVLDCIRSSNGVIDVQHSYNGPEYQNEVLGNPGNYITKGKTSYENGVLTCRFLRTIDIAVSTYTTSSDKIFSLNTAYYLLLGKGELEPSGLKVVHPQTPAVSSSKVDVREIGNVPTPRSNRVELLQAHGTLMITAWVLLVSTSIILARYFKTAWPGDKLCGVSVWFAVHRFLMLLGLVCTAIGFILIFVYEEGKYSKFEPTDSYYNLHAPLGIAVMILVIANPVIALFRCDPGTAKRPIFNWLHWLVGTTCHILAIITVFIGVKIGEDRKNFVNSAVFFMLIAFAAFHCVIEVVLTAHKFVGDMAAKRIVGMYQNDTNPVWGLKFRYAVLVIYGVVVTGLWLAMIVLIGAGIV